ncbi:DUF3223 domain-containing protein [Rhizobium laguerreae]|nr:DUF3223 domain-containing protein [Rhizobium laguerreae]
MPKKPVSLPNGSTWPSQQDAENHFRAIRDKYPPGDKITSGFEFDDLHALLKLYDIGSSPEDSKIGQRVEFETRVNRTNGGQTIGFWVVRTDGVALDFSFIKAVAWASRQSR